MAYYPIVLDLGSRPCLVVGGGSVAERKVEDLLAVGARITLVSPTLTPALERRVATGTLRHRRRRYRATDLRNQALAFAATGDPTTNAVVFRDAQARGIWVNAADDPERCDFILPSVLRRGPLMIAVASGGTAPALSAAVRERLETVLTERHGRLAEVVAEVRRELRARGHRAEPAVWRRVLAAELRRNGRDRRKSIRRRLLAGLGAA